MNQLNQAVKVLHDGGIVVYPTDTAYGLAVDATNASAVASLFKLKGREFKNPIHIIFPDTKWLNKIVKLNQPALKLMNEFLPGPLTLVLPLKAKGKSWELLSAGTKTMGVRLPNHKLAIQLVEALGKPITTTSANVSGEGNCYSVEDVQNQFETAGLKPDFYLDGGKLKNVAPSTVVSLIKDAKILRQGPITEKQIKQALK